MLRALLVTTALLVIWAGPVLGQDSPTATVSPAQAQLNDRAVEAVASGNWEKGARLFQASLDLGPLNITYLNLGRTLAKLGRCTEASDAYGQTLKAAKVASPSAVEVNAIVKRYQLELVDQCDGTVIVRCDPPEMEIQIDDGQAQACPEAPVVLGPGAHTIVGSVGGARVSTSVRVRGLTEATVDLRLEAPAADPVIGSSTSVAPPPQDEFNAAGWLTAGTGFALLSTALVLDVLWIQPDVSRLEDESFPNQSEFNALRDDVRGRQTTNLVILGVGAAVMATGVVLLLWNGAEEPEENAGWFLAPTGAGAHW
jgi:hypothetical protein